MHPQQETITNELIDQISAYGIANRPSEFEARLFLREADKLKPVNATEGWMISGMIHSLLNDGEKANASFKKSLALASPDHFNTVLQNYSKALVLLGEFDEAHALIEAHIGNENPGLISYAYHLSVSIGLIESALHYQELLKKLGDDELCYESHIVKIKEFSKCLNISDETIHDVYIIALSAIWENNGDAEYVTVSLSDSMIVLFHINADPESISEIEWNIADKLASSDIEIDVLNKITPIIKSIASN